MNILFDSNGLQSFFHLRDNHRLAVLISELNLEGHLVSFSSGRNIVKDELDKTDVLVVTTRHPRFSFSDNDPEIEIIHEFVNNGGGLLLMSNHGPRIPHQGQDLTENDSRLINGFEIEIQNTFFTNSLRSVPTVINAENLNLDHPIISGNGTSTINSIVTNTSCSLTSKFGETIASLPDFMIDVSNNRVPPTDTQKFAISLDLKSDTRFQGSGRIIVTADSGFIGSDNTLHPGPGQISKGNNIKFILKCLNWLANE